MRPSVTAEMMSIAGFAGPDEAAPAYTIYVKFLILCVVIFAPSAPMWSARTAQSRKPACNARNHGQFWPDDANRDADAARRYLQQGDLEMCSLEVWKYKWEHMSVNVRDLAKGKHSVTSEAGKAEAHENR